MRQAYGFEMQTSCRNQVLKSMLNDAREGKDVNKWEQDLNFW